ncbi:tyrosine-type recombinase/integrase [Embleya scabrispora]|uniref:tyrosine-type recombinase/integrase n=1 Tax=Embleya scabrispora TaxID=159449 RepID=UPI00037B830A|nr:tyrosine-type recombinase/integrase [Embleya scabrispora]
MTDKTYKVRIWAVSRNQSSKKPSYVLRWLVGTERQSATFGTKGLADRFRSRLIRAAEDGEPFDLVSGLPESMVKAKEATSVLAFALAYMEMKWPNAAAKSRDSMTDALATALPALVADAKGRPDVKTLRRALRLFLLPPTRREIDRPREITKAVAWIEKASLPITALEDAKRVHGVLDALGLKLDGTAAGAETLRRKRSVLYNVLDYAVELEHLTVNPIDKVKRKRIKVAASVDRRAVANPTQARELLTAVTYVGGHKRAGGRRLRAFFAVLYYAGTRPAEAVNLRRADCVLPESGWGSLTLHTTRPAAGKTWTDNGHAHDERGLKQRADKDTRPVPIPPQLVAMLRAHIEEFGTAPDGRLFPSERGGVLASSSYSRVWKEARRIALTDEQVTSPLAARPYDLRHACASLWLNAGVPATEVAERLGHSVDVLLKIYAKCIDGQRDLINKRISDGLGDDD